MPDVTTEETHDAPILVLGDGMRAFLAVIRSLGRAGFVVDAATSEPTRPELSSRYIRHIYRVPAPADGPQAFCEAIKDRLDRGRHALVIPTTDPTLLPLHYGRGLLGPHQIAMPPPQAFEASFDKFLTYQLTTHLGFPVPESIGLHEPEDPEVLIKALGLPLILKPRSSFSSAHLAQKAVVRVARNPAEIQLHLEDLLATGPVLAQRSFTGHGVGVGFLAHEGEPLVLFQHLRIHEPPRGGGSSYRRSEPLDEKLQDLVRRFTEATGYTGVGMLEFKRADNGEVMFIEANGRFWGSLPLALACGVDFPRYLYEMLVLGRRSFPTSYPAGVYARNLRYDVGWLVNTLRRTPRSSHVPQRPRSQVAWDVARALTARDHVDSWVRDDLRPGVQEALSLARLGAQRITRQVQTLSRALPVVRQQAQRALQQAFDRAESVLFVCKGNICRSPFAAAWLQQQTNARDGDAKIIRSGGYHPVAGRAPPPAAREAAQQLGINLEHHRSVHLDRRHVAEADLILVFDAENAEQVLRRFPETRAKIHHLDPAAPIADPYGTDLNRLRDTYQRIAACLARLENPQ